jgi:tetratricopeptide (TPR) repeat protein
MDYYTSVNQLDSAMSIVDSALESDGNNTLFLFAKSNLSLNMGKYEDCISISDSLIARNDTLPDVYLNAGVSCLNLALALESDVANKKKNSKKILDCYKRALPYMEKYREMAPDDKERWAKSLYNIYLKLNMGRKFEEISGVLRKMRK